MINLETVKTLRALRLPGMARELESQLEDPQRYKGLSFEDRLALLVDAESVSRRKNTIKRRITEARLSESQASIEAIEYHEDRELDKSLITKLATCAYIKENHHVVLKGALILCTQYDTDEWYFRIDCDRAEDEDSAVAEAILDRLIHNKYSIEVKGRISMRKRHAFSEPEESGVKTNG